MLALASLVAVTALAFGDAAAFSVSNTFGSHMALQRDSPIPVWGWGAPGAAVRVTVGTSTGAATVSADGFWRAVLPALPPSFTPTTLNATSTTTGETVILEDVLIGDVFLCSGQRWVLNRLPEKVDRM